MEKPAELVWTDVEFVAEGLKVDKSVAANVIRLLNDGCTVPFIARYRQNLIGSLEAANIRIAQRLLDESKQIREKIETCIEKIKKSGKLTKDLNQSFRMARSLEEVKDLFAPFKSDSIKLLSNRARAVGLEPAAQAIADGEIIRLENLIVPTTEGRQTIEEVQNGIKFILSDLIYKNPECQDFMRKAITDKNIEVSSQKVMKRSTTKKKQNKEIPKAKVVDENKFEKYFNFTAKLDRILPHQYMAMNRGEDLKLLSVKVVLPTNIKDNFNWVCRQVLRKTCKNSHWRSLFDLVVADCFDRLVKPAIINRTKAELFKRAEISSVQVFAKNLEELLLTRPLKGSKICSIDPGFSNGCKMALISESGSVLRTGVFFLTSPLEKTKAKKLLKETLCDESCERIAIGNGVGCRKVEVFISELIRDSVFSPLMVEYCIVSEDGASTYSVSKMAESEPDVKPLAINLRSAVSLARRVQDPLSEYVKVEPEHLGVGSYQHDVSKKLLKEHLESVVEECVSFVGVDVNTASVTILRHIAGLNSASAGAIVAYRTKNGPFTSREQLKEVKGIGPKSWEQSVGFLRICRSTIVSKPNRSESSSISSIDGAPTSRKRKKQIGDDEGPASQGKKSKLQENEFLDATAIHPESYTVALKIISLMNLDIRDVGTAEFNSVTRLFASSIGKTLADFSAKVQSDPATVQFILKALQQPLDYDMRNEELTLPLFRTDVRELEDLKVGQILTGSIRNKTNFGTFVDIGVGTDGLLHGVRQTETRGDKEFRVGSRVEVVVESLDLRRKKIGLRLNACC